MPILRITENSKSTRRRKHENDEENEDEVLTCFALVTRSFRGNIIKMPRRRAIAMLMITWPMMIMLMMSMFSYVCDVLDTNIQDI